jgi:glutaredoxin
MNKIEIYTNETCPYCKQIKEELTNKNIDFENKSTPDFAEEWQDVINLTGMPTVPTIKCNNEYFIPGRDFQSPQQLINLLETFKDSSFSETRKTLERMKTLNFHINTAFGRMDQLLRQIETKINKEDEHKSTS